LPRVHPRPALLPYTTLFRSSGASLARARIRSAPAKGWLDTYKPSISRSNASLVFRSHSSPVQLMEKPNGALSPPSSSSPPPNRRSEEHTSELQSRDNLVCRL